MAMRRKKSEPKPEKRSGSPFEGKGESRSERAMRESAERRAKIPKSPDTVEPVAQNEPETEQVESGRVRRKPFRRVVTYLDMVDVDKYADEVLAMIEKDPDPNDVNGLRLAVASAARLGYRAATLVDLARMEERRVRREVEQQVAFWETEAVEFWAQEKAADEDRPADEKKLGGKRVTKDMIQNYAKDLYATQWSRLMDGKVEAEAILANMQHLHEMLRERMWGLRALLGVRSISYQDASREAGRGADGGF